MNNHEVLKKKVIQKYNFKLIKHKLELLQIN